MAIPNNLAVHAYDLPNVQWTQCDKFQAFVGRPGIYRADQLCATALWSSPVFVHKNCTHKACGSAMDLLQQHIFRIPATLPLIGLSRAFQGKLNPPPDAVGQEHSQQARTDHDSLDL